MYIPAVGSYANLTNSTSANAKTEVKALLDVFLALFQVSPATGNAAKPDMNTFDPQQVDRIKAEITAIKAAITAGA